MSPTTTIGVGTHGGKGIRQATGGDLHRAHPRAAAPLSADRVAIRADRRRARPLDAAIVTAGLEQARALGEFMIAAPALIDRYQAVGESPEGVAVTRAAVEWRRAGLIRPAPADALEALYQAYVNGPADHERFHRGLGWATALIYAHVALLQGSDDYEPYDYVAAAEDRAIRATTFKLIIERFATTDELAADVGLAALDRGDSDKALLAFSRADAGGHPIGAYNLGVLLKQRRALAAPKPPTAALTTAATRTAPATCACCSSSAETLAAPKPRIAARTIAATQSAPVASASCSRGAETSMTP